MKKNKYKPVNNPKNTPETKAQKLESHVPVFNLWADYERRKRFPEIVIEKTEEKEVPKKDG